MLVTRGIQRHLRQGSAMGGFFITLCLVTSAGLAYVWHQNQTRSEARVPVNKGESSSQYELILPRSSPGTETSPPTTLVTSPSSSFSPGTGSFSTKPATFVKSTAPVDHTKRDPIRPTSKPQASKHSSAVAYHSSKPQSMGFKAPVDHDAAKYKGCQSCNKKK